MAEYRLDELAQISGVSARNIRAYRERGLLDPPRRVGRSAFYDDYHLSQLRTISQLHRRGFNTVHIAEFFASLREGADLADILGIQRAVLGPRPDNPPVEASSDGLAIGADSDEARRLLEAGLAEVVDGRLVLTDPAVRKVVARSSDELVALRALLHIFEATRGAVDALAAQFMQTLGECLAAQFGADRAPTPDNVDELARAVRDYHDLWTSVVFGRLDEALHRHMAATDPDGGGQQPPLNR
ncbi:MerR family transcriptional regulator [Mycolicibacterium celeriflavum]|uniref:MerR family transcriptional regulator n=1 Tax=Mycolicibacterium celeriflavum TaxID=1249101 RepID=UPI003CF68292